MSVTLDWMQDQVDLMTEKDIIVAEFYDPWAESFQFYAEITNSHEGIIWANQFTTGLSKDTASLILSHEVGHIELNHRVWEKLPGNLMIPVESPEVTKRAELEADAFGKRLLRELGWSEKKINLAITNFFKRTLSREEWNNCPTVISGHYPTWEETVEGYRET